MAKMQINQDLYIQGKNKNLGDMYDSIPSTIGDLYNDVGYVAKSSMPTLWGFSTSHGFGEGGLDEFKTYLTDNAPGGFSWWYCGFNGAVYCAICMKANSSYLSFILWSYAYNAQQFKKTGTTWSQVALG